MSTCLYLNAATVREALPMTRSIEAMRAAMSAVSRGEIAMPPRLFAALADKSGSIGLMPASATEPAVYAAKVISLHPGNAPKGLPAIQGMVILFDHATGAPVAIMDAAELTAIRTAAASGLAIDVLARKGAGAHGVLGTGVQARTHVLAALAVRPALTETFIWGRNHEKALRLAEELCKETRSPVRAVRTPEEAAACDVVSAVTGASEPLLKGAWLSPGAHVNLVGAHQPDRREADTQAIVRSSVWVDLMESAMREAGDILIPISEGAIAANHVRGEIGEVVTGAKTGRRTEKEITLYKSLGVAAQDLFAAHAAYLAARETGSGQLLA